MQTRCVILADGQSLLVKAERTRIAQNSTGRMLPVSLGWRKGKQAMNEPMTMTGPYTDSILKERSSRSAALDCSADLLPCPFCGRNAPGPKCGTYMIAVADGTAVRCPTCNAHGPVCPTFDQAIEQWNKRKPNPSHHDGAAPAPSVDGVVGSLNKEG